MIAGRMAGERRRFCAGRPCWPFVYCIATSSESSSIPPVVRAVASTQLSVIKRGSAPLASAAPVHLSSQATLIRSFLPALQGFGFVGRGRDSGRRGSQVRFLVLGLADVALHLILVDLVHYQFDGLRTVGEREHQRLKKIHVLLFKLPVIHYQNDIVVTLFDVHPSQGEAEWPLRVKLLGLVNLKLVIIALPALLEQRQLVMGLGNGTAKLIAGRVQVILQFLARLAGFLASCVNLLLSRLDLLLLVAELRLHLAPARIVCGPG